MSWEVGAQTLGWSRSGRLTVYTLALRIRRARQSFGRKARHARSGQRSLLGILGPNIAQVDRTRPGSAMMVRMHGTA